jgi:hypothetical protein
MLLIPTSGLLSVNGQMVYNWSEVPDFINAINIAKNAEKKVI